ncbi:MAG: hypothetical protein JWO14_3365 [Solirubrobacterales bacterium]|nr:hypothetical protein [Solirubrobacterales bacterium]
MIAALGSRVTGLALRVARFVAGWISVASAWLFRALRPLLMWFFRGLAAGEAGLRALGRGATMAATAAATVLTPRRAIGLVLAASGALLAISQFIDYHGVQIGEQVDLPGGIKSAPPPTVDLQTAGHAHSYVLVPVGAIAVGLGLVLIWRGGRAARMAALGAIVAGAASAAVILLIDLPHGLDVGTLSSRFASASAVLEKGFSAELAAAGAMLLSGLLYIARPCLIRINLSGRAASARRRRPRRRASSRATVARRA